MRKNFYDGLKDGQYQALPIEWGLISPNADATFSVIAYDRKGRALPFYTGSSTDKTLVSSDGTNDDGILLVDLSVLADSDSFVGLLYTMLNPSVSLGDIVCYDGEYPGTPPGCVRLDITLVTADTSGSGTAFYPCAWDPDKDGNVGPFNTKAEVISCTYVNNLGLGVDATDPYLTPRVDSSSPYRLLNVGDSLSIGWGA